MANEITISAGIQLIKNGVSIAASVSKVITQAENGNIATVQSIGLATEALVLTDIDNIGYVFVKNLDPTNFVMLGLVTPVLAANAMITLLPGEFALFPTRLETIYSLADTAACLVQVIGLEL